MQSKSKIFTIVLLFLMSPFAAFAASIDYSTNPITWDCTGADHIEIYDLTADNYLPGYADSDAGNCAAETLLVTEGNDYEGNLTLSGNVVLSFSFTGAAPSSPPPPVSQFAALALFGTSTMAAAAENIGATTKISTSNTIPFVFVVLGLIIAFYSLELMFTLFPDRAPEEEKRRGKKK